MSLTKSFAFTKDISLYVYIIKYTHLFETDQLNLSG